MEPNRFKIVWSVEEVIGGQDFDRGLRHGDRITIASGEVVKDGDEMNLRAGLTAALEMSFPKHEMGGTYEMNRVYHIELTPVGHNVLE